MAQTTLFRVGTYLIRTWLFLMHVSQGNVGHTRQFWIVRRLLVQSPPAECRSLQPDNDQCMGGKVRRGCSYEVYS